MTEGMAFETALDETTDECGARSPEDEPCWFPPDHSGDRHSWEVAADARAAAEDAAWAGWNRWPSWQPGDPVPDEPGPPPVK
jgi:hypothetical protein